MLLLVLVPALLLAPLLALLPALALPLTAPKYSGIIDCLSQIARNEGVRALYAGIVPVHKDPCCKFLN